MLTSKAFDLKCTETLEIMCVCGTGEGECGVCVCGGGGRRGGDLAFAVDRAAPLYLCIQANGCTCVGIS